MLPPDPPPLASQRPPPATEHCLDRYYFVKRVGEGGFGSVFEAVDMETGEFVALKIPRKDDRRIHADFHREYAIARNFSHRNVVPIFELLTVLGAPVLVYPLGQTTVSALIDNDELPAERAIMLAGQLLEGLAHVHARGYLHCDLKPDNLLVFPGDRLGLTDFGLARARDGDCLSNSYSGTEDYMAPEHLLHGHVSPQSDVYEAALVIVEMFTGEVPELPLETSLLACDVDGRPCPPRVRALEPVLRRALAYEKRSRYPDASAMASAFWRRVGMRPGRGARVVTSRRAAMSTQTASCGP